MSNGAKEEEKKKRKKTPNLRSPEDYQ